MQGSPKDAVKATADLTSRLRSQLDQARKHPEQELGMSTEELARRQKEAQASRTFVSPDTRKKFEVKSTARAQQIMNAGVNKRQLNKRKNDLKQSMKIVRRFQIGGGIFAAFFLGYLFKEYLLPQYVAVQDRKRRMQIRQERANAKLEEFIKESQAEGSGGELEPVVLSGGVARITRPAPKEPTIK